MSFLKWGSDPINLLYRFLNAFVILLCCYLGKLHHMCTCVIVCEKLKFRLTEALKIKRRMGTKLNYASCKCV